MSQQQEQQLPSNNYFEDNKLQGLDHEDDDDDRIDKALTQLDMSDLDMEEGELNLDDDDDDDEEPLFIPSDDEDDEFKDVSLDEDDYDDEYNFKDALK